MQIVHIGLNHRTAAIELRERTAFDRNQARAAMDQLRSRGLLEEIVILSTCGRSELYGVTERHKPGVTGAMEEFLTSFHRVGPAELSSALYRHRDRDAIRHLFRVAAGLDSMLLGETEILGQVREAYGSAFRHGATGRVLNRLFQAALEVGKRVRTETQIGVLPVSVAYAGVKLAETIFGRLDSHKALILGAGATSMQVAQHLCHRGIREVRVLNRTFEKARDVAERFGGQVVPWENLAASLEWPDVIVASASCQSPILTREMLERALLVRGGRRLLLIDLGVPRNVTSDAALLDGVSLYNIDDLTGIVEANKKARLREVPRAESIIEAQMNRFMHWQAGVAASSVLAELRTKPAAVRHALLRERLAGLTNISEEGRLYAAGLLERSLNLEPGDFAGGGKSLPKIHCASREEESRHREECDPGNRQLVRSGIARHSPG